MQKYAVYWPEGGAASQYSVLIYWPENVIDWLGKWRPTCVMREDRNFKASDVSGPSIWIFILCSWLVRRLLLKYQLVEKSQRAVQF